MFNFENELELLKKAAADSHGRVRLAAATTASYLPQTEGLSIIDKIREKGIKPPYTASLDDAERALQNSSEPFEEEKHHVKVPDHLSLSEGRLFIKGAEIYEKEGYCGTCHQENGHGTTRCWFPSPCRNKVGKW